MFQTFMSSPLKRQRLAGSVASVLLHCGFAIVVFTVAAPEVMESRSHATILYLPPVSRTEVRPHPTVTPKPVPKSVPAMPLPHLLKAEVLLLAAPTIPLPSIPEVALNLLPSPVSPIPAPPIHKPEIRTGAFESGTTPVTNTTETRVTSQSTGFDSFAAAPAKNTHASVITGAFNEVAETVIERPQLAEVALTEFDAVAAKPLPRPLARSAKSGLRSPIEITSKPRPLYTDEARRLHIEGDVVLQVSFRASSEVCVLRVLHGLGHGLDQNAISAASSIRFRPATESGQPVDDVALVRITFQLAD